MGLRNGREVLKGLAKLDPILGRSEKRIGFIENCRATAIYIVAGAGV
jgi:hypothetical protein